MTDAAVRHRIEICLGSSCFAKGSGRLAEVASAWAQGGAGSVALVGHRCQERCAEGPRVVVDGTEHRVRDVAALERLLAGLHDPGGT